MTKIPCPACGQTMQVYQDDKGWIGECDGCRQIFNETKLPKGGKHERIHVSGLEPIRRVSDETA